MWVMEDEINLRPYIQALFRRWYWILGFALAAAGVAFVVTSLLPKEYEAKATLLLQRVRYEVAFVSSLRTEEDQSLVNRAGLEQRLEGYVVLAENPSVGAAVIRQQREQLPAEVRNLQDLRSRVQVESQGDLVIIKARGSTPRAAADIANAWAEQAEKDINAIYVQTLPQAQVSELQAQLEKADANYRTAQSALEAYLAESRLPGLEQALAYRQLLVDSYQQALADSEQVVYGQAMASARQVLVDYYDGLAATQSVLVDARAMEDQFERTQGAPATAWAEALAFIGLQNRAFGLEAGQLQVDLSEEAPETASADLEALIQVLETKADVLLAAIDQAESDLLHIEASAPATEAGNSLQQRMEALTEEIATIQAQQEEEMARERELTAARDLAWETHQTVARKVAETGVAEELSGSEVRMATQALPPERPVSPSRLKNTAIAGGLGLLVGLVGALAVAFSRQEL
jgi:uncharacterized protein involved in exopolysaccharide biosynthesis